MPWILRVGAKKFAVAIQKRGKAPPRKPETYYVSPAFHPIQKPLDLFTVMHNFCAQEAKNFLSVTCAVQDTGKHILEDGRVISNDFCVMFGKQITYAENLY